MFIYEPALETAAPYSCFGYRLVHKQSIKAYRVVEAKLHMS
jgi:hypothetical protein